jgi:hypothetical protein
MPDKTVESIINQAPGAGVKRCRNSSQNTTVADMKAICKRTHLIGKSEYSDFVFTPLSDAIREWEETGDSKARNDLLFNILATVRKWSKPKESKGVNS